MPRKSKREIERAVEQIDPETDDDRPSEVRITQEVVDTDGEVVDTTERVLEVEYP